MVLQNGVEIWKVLQVSLQGSIMQPNEFFLTANGLAIIVIFYAVLHCVNLT